MRLIWAGLLVVAVAAPGQLTPNPDFRETAVIGAFHRHNPAIVHFTTLYRGPVSPYLDLAVVRGGVPGPGWNEPKDVDSVGQGDLLGLFLLSKTDPNRAYEIAIDPEAGTLGHAAKVLWSGDGAVVLSRHSDYGLRGPRLKYFFNIRSKALLARREFSPGSTEIEAGPDGPQLTPADAGYHERLALRNPSACPPVEPFGPGGSFRLVSDRVGFTSLPGCAIGSPDRTFAVPKSSTEDFRAARPEAAGRFFSIEGLDFNETIGPAQLFEDRLWFGITFYDGEGATGVGGFGWFDPASEKLEVIRPPEMADWSASAILVEEDAVWLGLMRRPEGAEYSGGLIRWDRSTREIQRWPDAPLAREMQRNDRRLLLAGDGGGAVVEGGRLQIYFTDVDLEGRRQLTAAPVTRD